MPRFAVISNPNFIQPPQFVRVIVDPHDASKDLKILRENAERAWQRGALDFDIGANAYVEVRR